MSLNIKNEETCRLASELAQLTGETMTGAITVALRERLEREKRERDAESPGAGPSGHSPPVRRQPPRRAVGNRARRFPL